MRFLQYALTIIFALFLVSCEEKEPCSKVDFLIVIDNSGSMEDKQVRLSEQFSTMIDEINSMSKIQDYRIGVVTTDAYAFNHEGCRNIGSLVTQVPKTKDPDLLKLLFDKITNNPNEVTPEDLNVCLEDSSRPWLEKGDAKLKEKFQCLVQVGARGNPTERPLEAFRDSFTSSCNNSFFRPDAMLVTMIVTDEDDNTAFAQGIYSDIMASRNNLPNQVVVLPLIQTNGAPNLTKFAQMFPNHYIADIGSSNYSAVLKTGASKLETACDAYLETCPTNECCMPPDIMPKVVGFTSPLVVFGLFGLLLGRKYGKAAGEKRGNVPGAEAFGRFLGGLIGTATAAGIWFAFCGGCFAYEALYYIITLGVITAVLGVRWFSSR